MALAGAGMLARRIGVVQMCSGPDPAANLAKVAAHVAQAGTAGCALVCLPEAFDYIATSPEESLRLAQPLDGPLFMSYRDLARQHGVWLSLGGFHQLADDGRMFNTHALVNSAGQLVASYCKTHLFDVDLPCGKKITESATTAPGSRLVSVRNTPVGNVGLSVCYDLRFAPLYNALRHQGECDVILIPSAFMPATGAAHWEPLLRARAIETQSYVVAAAQAGAHHAARTSYGHTMAVDPWGKVLLHMDGDSEGLGIFDIDPAHLHDVRARMPVARHARWDVYGDARNAIMDVIDAAECLT
eukprot:m.19381 g.19381  ORF g.19381 m.19381 type:complete len:300 (+) comp3434_c0_seq1:1104-2003(+)